MSYKTALFKCWLHSLYVRNGGFLCTHNWNLRKMHLFIQNKRDTINLFFFYMNIENWHSLMTFLYLMELVNIILGYLKTSRGTRLMRNTRRSCLRPCRITACTCAMAHSTSLQVDHKTYKVNGALSALKLYPKSIPNMGHILRRSRFLQIIFIIVKKTRS